MTSPDLAPDFCRRVLEAFAKLEELLQTLLHPLKVSRSEIGTPSLLFHTANCSGKDKIFVFHAE